MVGLSSKGVDNAVESKGILSHVEPPALSPSLEANCDGRIAAAHIHCEMAARFDDEDPLAPSPGVSPRLPAVGACKWASPGRSRKDNTSRRLWLSQRRARSRRVRCCRTRG
jgi:hypothetical protein